MLRRFVAALTILFLCFGVILAAELKGKVTKVQNEEKKKAIFVKVEGQEKDVRIGVGKKTKLVDKDGKEIKLDDVKEGNKVTATYEEKEKDGKKFKLFSEIKVEK